MRETRVDADLTPGVGGLGRAAEQRFGHKDAALGVRPVDAATIEPATAEIDEITPWSRENAPRWYDMMTLSCIVVLATVGASGLLLAVIGRYATVAALAIGLPLAVLGVFILHRGLPPGATSRAAHLGAGIAVAIAIGYAVFAGITPSQNVVVSRDPGSYMTTAVQLTQQGALEIDARGQAFEGIRGLQFSGAAVYDTGRPFPAKSVSGEPGEIRESGIIESQFNHFASVALAVGLDVGGNRLMFRLPALMAALGLLALYSVTVRATGRPLLSLLAPALLAVSMPLLFVARNTYSESFTLVLLWGAVLVLLGVHSKPRPSVAAVGGVLLGALVCTRIDASMYVCMLFPLAAVSIATSGSRAVRVARIRAWLLAVVATAVVASIGWWDLNQRTGLYVEHLSPQLRLLVKALIASAVVSAVAVAVWSLVPQVRRFCARVSRPIATIAAAVVGAAMLFGWLVRPQIQTSMSTQKLPVVQMVQERDGLPLEPFRNYAEDSLQWMSWYIGAPALLLAIGGLMWGTWKVLRGRGHSALVTLLVLCLGSGALYWYAPQITPDQIWASRRFVPAVLPALAVWATVAVAVCASVRRVRRLPRTMQHAVAGAAAIVLIVPPAVVTSPVMWQRSQAGYLQPILASCDAVGPDAAVIVVGGWAGATLPQSLRSWCDVPVAAAGTGLGPDNVAQVAAQVRDNGYRLVLLAADAASLKGYQVDGRPAIRSTVGVVNPWTPEATLDRPPSKYVVPGDVLPVPEPFALHILEVGAP